MNFKMNKCDIQRTHLGKVFDSNVFYFSEREKGREKKRQREGGREGDRFVVLLIYIYFHWLLLVCALTGDRTHNLGVPGQYSNQLGYLAKASNDLT